MTVILTITLSANTLVSKTLLKGRLSITSQVSPLDFLQRKKFEPSHMERYLSQKPSTTELSDLSEVGFSVSKYLVLARTTSVPVVNTSVFDTRELFVNDVE
jgi:hypothetical protein